MTSETVKFTWQKPRISQLREIEPSILQMDSSQKFYSHPSSDFTSFWGWLFVVVCVIIFVGGHYRYNKRISESSYQILQPPSHVSYAQLEELKKERFPLVWLDTQLQNHLEKSGLSVTSLLQEEVIQNTNIVLASHVMGKAREWIQTPVSTFLTWCQELEEKSISQNVYTFHNRKLWQDTSCQEILESYVSTLASPWSWVKHMGWDVAPSHSVIPLQQHRFRSLWIGQCEGIKYIQLYHPSQTPYLSPEDNPSSKTTRWSQIGLDTKTETTFPQYSQAKYTEIILKPGQWLWIPPWWWWCIRHEGTNLSVSFQSETWIDVMSQWIGSWSGIKKENIPNSNDRR